MRRNPDASRANILRAATHAFASHGFEGARVEGIARAAQVNKRMLYHYFGDKRALYTAVVRACISDIEEAGLSEPSLNLEQWRLLSLRDYDRDPAFTPALRKTLEFAVASWETRARLFRSLAIQAFDQLFPDLVDGLLGPFSTDSQRQKALAAMMDPEGAEPVKPKVKMNPVLGRPGDR